MKTKQLVEKTFMGKDAKKWEGVKNMTTTNIAIEVLKVMKNHIGSDNAISRGKLFKAIFGTEEQLNFIDEFKWDYVKKAMHLCRKKTKCFIGSRKSDKGYWEFFVLESKVDAQFYIENLNRTVKAIRGAQLRAMSSVRNKHYKINWLAELDTKKQLGYTGEKNDRKSK